MVVSEMIRNLDIFPLQGLQNRDFTVTLKAGGEYLEHSHKAKPHQSTKQHP
jgi:hypothetical protein